MNKDSRRAIAKAVTCPSCQALNSQSAEFCAECGYPLGKVATLDPVESIRTQGLLFRKATEGRPQRIVLIGIWVCFLPGLVVGVYAAFRLILNQSGFFGFFFFWAMVGLSYAAFVILYRTTKNYLTVPERGGRRRRRRKRIH